MVHPLLPQTELRAFCAERGIAVQAFTSLGRATEPPKCLYGNWEPSHPKLVTRDDVKAIAAELGKSPAQVLLQWAVQQGIPVIPKAVTPAHIAENAALDFTLSAAHMETLGKIAEEGPIAYAYQPEKVPV